MNSPAHCAACGQAKWLPRVYEDLLAENERLRRRTDKELVRENEHLKSEIKRLQNSMDRLRMELSDANSRVEFWRSRGAK
jgi:predicted RNase H-like nuclease (RuvC/YqgF family)